MNKHKVTGSPPGWAKTTLAEMCTKALKHDPREHPDELITYIDIGGIDSNLIRETKTLLGAVAPSRARQIVAEGDTVLSTVRTYLRKTAMIPADLHGATASTGFCVLRPLAGVEPRFVFYRVIESSFVSELSARQTGSSYPAVRDSDVLEQSIALPPLNEQRRIVAAIEEHLSRLDAAEASLASASKRVGALRAAQLNEALHGDWPTEPLGDVARTVRNGLFVSRPSTSPPGIPIFRISAVRPMALDVGDLRYASVDRQDAEPFLTQEGDLLFTRYSGNAEYVGACARVPRMDEQVLHPDKLIRVVVDRSRVEPAFVELACSAGATRDQIRARRKTTAGQVGIAGGQLRTVRVPVPPLEEQRRIVARVEEQLSAIDALRASIERSQRRSASLSRAILERAFRGELVPQDPTDEPARALLDRIRGEREAAPSRPARRRVKT